MKRIFSAVILSAGVMWLAAANAADPVTATNPAAGATIKVSDLFTNMVVARGKGFEITRAQLDDEMIYARSSAAARGQNLAPEQMRVVEKQLLQQLIFLRVLLVRATDADKAAGKQSADKQFQDMLDAISKNPALAVNLESRLKSVGLTREQLHKQWNDRAIGDAVVRRELKINITDDEVKSFYTNNPAQFEMPEMVHAAHILLMTIDPDTGKELPELQKAERLKTMEELLKRARAGENFSNIVHQYSEDPGSKNNGGEYTFPRGKMYPEFEAAAFSLATNQVSDIVTTRAGYHIIKLYEKIPAKKVELEKVSSEVKEALAQQTILKQVPDYMKKVENEAGVDILDKDLKPIPDETELPQPAPTMPAKSNP